MAPLSSFAGALTTRSIMTCETARSPFVGEGSTVTRTSGAVVRSSLVTGGTLDER